MKLLVAILLLGALLAGLGWWFFGRDEARSGWSPERIAEEPLAYLDWALAEIDRRDEDLARRRGAAQGRLDEARRGLRSAEVELEQCTALLAEARRLWRPGGEGIAWPVRLAGRPLDREAFAATVRETEARRVETEARLVAERGRLDDLERLLGTIETARERLRSRRPELLRRREAVALGREIEDLEGLSDDVASMLAVGEALGGGGDAPLRLDDLLEGAKEGPDDLDAILGDRKR